MRSIHTLARRRGRGVARGFVVAALEGDHGLGCGREARRREPRHRRRAAAEESDMAEPVALERDRAAGVAPGLDRLAEGRRDVAEPRLQPVADTPQPVDPGIGRRVRLGMANHDGRRLGGGMGRDDPVQPVRIEGHGAARHVAPGPRPADVDPPVQRAHLALRARSARRALLCAWTRWVAPRVAWQVGDEAFGVFMARTMPRPARPVHRTMVRGVREPPSPSSPPAATRSPRPAGARRQGIIPPQRQNSSMSRATWTPIMSAEAPTAAPP